MLISAFSPNASRGAYGPSVPVYSLRVVPVVPAFALGDADPPSFPRWLVPRLLVGFAAGFIYAWAAKPD